MSSDTLEEILTAYRAGERTIDDVVAVLQKRSIADLGFANVDLDRTRRRGARSDFWGQ